MDVFVPFSYLIALANMSSTILSRSGERRYSYLVPDFRGMGEGELGGNWGACEGSRFRRKGKRAWRLAREGHEAVG